MVSRGFKLENGLSGPNLNRAISIHVVFSATAKFKYLIIFDTKFIWIFQIF